MKSVPAVFFFLSTLGRFVFCAAEGRSLVIEVVCLTDVSTHNACRLMYQCQRLGVYSTSRLTLLIVRKMGFFAGFGLFSYMHASYVTFHVTICYIIIIIISFYICISGNKCVPVTTVWRIIRLQVEERPAVRGGSWQ